MPLVRYAWLTNNQLPIPDSCNPFHVQGEERNMGMRCDSPRSLNRDDQKKIRGLLKQLTGQDHPNKSWQPGLEAPNIYSALARLDKSAVGNNWWEADQIVGMASFLLIDQLTGRRARIEDVVVNQEMREQGIAKELLRRLHALAHDFGCLHVDLTSASSRREANALYQKLGYECRETNLYRLKL